MSSRGLFLVLEGIDGSGTTTQLSLVAEELRAKGHRVITTCEPSTGPIGKFVRAMLSGGPPQPNDAGVRGEAQQESAMPKPEEKATRFDWRTWTLLFAADRRDHLAREVEPALEQGCLVLSDRYLLSSLLYQSATSSEPALALSWVRAANHGTRAADLIIVLDIDPSLAQARRAGRGGAEEVFERAELQRRLASLYARAEEFDSTPMVHVDASRAVSEVTAAIVGHVTRLTSPASP